MWTRLACVLLAEVVSKPAWAGLAGFSVGTGSGGHYGGHAETYMNVGDAMGKAMAKLLEGKQ